MATEADHFKLPFKSALFSKIYQSYKGENTQEFILSVKSYNEEEPEESVSVEI